MSRRIIQSVLYPLAALITCAGIATAQGPRPRPFAAAALMAGPQGFARPPVNSALVGGYVYLPVGPGLIGIQAGMAPGEPNDSRAVHGLVTAGLPVYRGLAWQSYPFLGYGRGIMRAARGADDVRAVYAAGLGFDARVTAQHGLLVGTRVGYLTRSAGDDNSMAYVTLSIGYAGRR